MKLSAADCEQAARDLYRAEQERRQIGLLSLRYPAMDMEDAYAVQSAFVRLKREGGAKPVGWKVGLTSKAMQRALNIDIPDSGVLFDDMLFANGAAVPAGRFIRPRAEAEIAFVMKTPLDGATADCAAVLAAADYVAPCAEILDTRIIRKDAEANRMRGIFDTIADNAANAGVVLGDSRHRPGRFDLRRVGAVVWRNGEVEETGLGAGVLGHPAKSVAWLARRLFKYGMTIGGGDIVLSGSFIRPLECPPGASIRADFGNFGEVQLSFL